MTAPADGLTSQEQQLLDWLERMEVAGQVPTLDNCPPELRAHVERLPGWLDCVRGLDVLAERAGAPPRLGDQSAVSAAHRLPRDFGPYELEEELGRGGMGVVYLARHRALRTHFALKMIRASEFAAADEIRRFFQEARAAAQLRHPHIVSVHDAGEIGQCPFLVMRYVRGETLAVRLKRGLPESSETARIMQAVARAVQYLHEQGIVHRDLKPSNILLDESGQPQVTDFGLIKLFRLDGERTATGAVIGTPAYMAPEQAWGRPEQVGPACDIYSLGAILYQCLAGRPPFPEERPLDQILRLRDADPRPPRSLNREVPEELEQICLRCLEKQPQNRYGSAGMLADDLRRFLDREPIALPAISWSKRFQRWLRREPALVSHLIGFAVIAVIEQVVSLTTRQPREAYLPVMSVLGVWTVLAVIMQKLLHRELNWVKLVWVGVDGILFTAAVAFAEGPIESLVVGYALLIAASGLWYQTSLVWLMTVVSIVSYLLLTSTQGGSRAPLHYPFIVTGILGVIGGCVAALVRRIRKLLHQATGR